MNLEKVLSYPIKPVEQTISEKDCMLYSLGIGLGADPVDPKQLQFVYEQDLKVFPSHSVVIAHPGEWMRDPELEIDWIKLLHGEQTLTLHYPLMPETTYVGNYKVLGVIDKGVEKGSILCLQKTLTERKTGRLVSTVSSSYFLRGDGGCGSSGYTPVEPVTFPERGADRSISIPTAGNAALIYRLSGDYNPIHCDPQQAKKAGFERPILHGLSAFGIATRAVLDTYCESNPERIEFVGMRFSSPVYPGEHMQVNFWEGEDGVKFQATVIERNTKVLEKGLAKFN